MRKLFGVALILALTPTAVEARKKVMTIGKDTTSFHTELFGRTVVTEDPHEDFAIRFGTLTWTSTNKKHAAGIGVRMIDGYNNAFAVIHKGEPYVLFDASMWGNAGGGALKEMVLYGHELGHHACGHLKGKLADRPWDKELEADRFAGAAIRSYIEAGYRPEAEDVFLPQVLDAVDAVFITAGAERGGSTHPPLSLRRAAYENGWNGGSPCKL